MVAATKNGLLSSELAPYWARPLAREMRLFAERARGKRLESRVDFARRNIVLPEGPHKDFRWRPEYQPFCAAALELMDTCGKRKFRFSGCVQSGKSFIGVICVLWHLFERGEDVGYAVPDLDQSARDKWQNEFLPVIMASPTLRRMLPDSGEGSKGGTPTLIKFNNGATLRFISGGGGDHHRSNFTVHVVFKTEVDRYDTQGEVSREASQPEQIENRTEAFGDLAWSYEECTVTTEEGRIWTELQESTNHTFHVKCVHCEKAVIPGREDLHGIEECKDYYEAREKGHFRCPKCGEKWTAEHREQMLDALISVGAGQTCTIGTDGSALVEGDLTRTEKCGFTWSAFHNRLWSVAKIAGDEWNALYSKKSSDLELKRRQHAWTLPSEPDVYAVTPLSVRDIMERAAQVDLVDTHWSKTIPLRYAPPKTIGMTAGIDVAKRWLHFIVRAFYQTESGVNSRVIDVGEVPVRTDEIGLKKALIESVLALDDRFGAGYAVWQDEKAERLTPELRGIDGGWQGKELGRRQEDLVWLTLLELVKQQRHGWLMILGRGQSEPPGKGSYSHPKALGRKKDKNAVIWKGEQCHIRKSADHAKAFASAGAPNPASYCIANVDEYKELLRSGYADIPVGEDGAMLSFNVMTKAERELLRKYSKQVTAENRLSRHVLGRGRVIVFDNQSQAPNHFGDADVYAIVMAAILGLPITVMPKEEPIEQPKKEAVPVRSPGGQKYLATQR